MRKIVLALAIVIISLIGILDASYITYEKLSGNLPPCNPIFKCGDVLSSPWSSIGPIPLSLLGMGFYLTFFGLACWYVTQLDPDNHNPRRQELIVKIMATLGVFGFGFSLYLLFIMGVILQAWCFYCLLSAVNCVLLFGSSWWLYRTD